ncbi:MAG TPA: c-type cytochrome biogenesis protein CcmI [Azospirillum sp.]|nr:c-type cytochrome biogenesis protein CcmI [Azospirillum sp.]
MLFWIVAAALTAAVVLLIVPPLLKPRTAASADRAAYDLEVYRDQLAELVRDQARGLITEAQAAAARAEIGRRMLAVADQTPQAATAPRAARVVAALIAVALPVGALAVYLPLGHPDVPAMPLASRNLDAERGHGGPPPQVAAALEKLKQHLADDPKDVRGWDLLGRTYARAGKYEQAAEAFRRGLDVTPGDPELTAGWAEMTTNANDGIVPEEARRAFESVLAKEPKDPRARFYLALARQQAGDVQGALDRWRAMMAETPADAPWLPAIQARITEAAQRLNLDPAKIMPTPLPPETAQDQSGEMDAEQKAMVRGMVESLAAKMADNPTDVEGWKRLARSYTVLGEHDKAVEAAKRAVDQAPKRPDVLLVYADTLLARGPQAGGAQMPAEAVGALRDVLAAEPANREALWLLGLDAANTGRKSEAAELWGRLLPQLDPKDPDHAFVRQRIEALKAGG